MQQDALCFELSEYMWLRSQYTDAAGAGMQAQALTDSPVSPLEVEPSVESVSFRSDPSSPASSCVDGSVSSKPGLSKLSLSSIPEVFDLAALVPLSVTICSW